MTTGLASKGAVAQGAPLVCKEPGIHSVSEKLLLVGFQSHSLADRAWALGVLGPGSVTAHSAPSAPTPLPTNTQKTDGKRMDPAEVRR